MNRIVIGIFTLALILSACAPPTPAVDQPSIIIDRPTKGTNDMTPAQIAALTHLSQTLGLSADQITLISSDSVTWTDGCLGVQRAGVMCTQALVEGFRITFEASGNEYELHTNETGSKVVIASGPLAGSAIEVVLIKKLTENLGKNEGDIFVVSNEPAEFGDTCLGVVMQDVMCADVITPGHIVVLESGGVRYEYHVSEDGTHIQPATLALTWSREGGIVGFCDRLTVFLSGEVFGNHCKSQPNETMGAIATLLTAEESESFNAWMTEYGSVTLDASDPKGVADGMSITLVLFGSGKESPGKDVEAELFTWAQDMFQELYK